MTNYKSPTKKDIEGAEFDVEAIEAARTAYYKHLCKQYLDMGMSEIPAKWLVDERYTRLGDEYWLALGRLSALKARRKEMLDD